MKIFGEREGGCMSPATHTGQGFEDRVEHQLLRRGWRPAIGTYDAELGLDTGALWEFVVTTQAEAWRRLLELYGGDQDTAKQQFTLRVVSQIDLRGVLDVLRYGVTDRGVRVNFAYFRSGADLATGVLERYNANVLGVARQLRFSHRDPGQSVDLALFVNGLPIATVELTDSRTGQDARHAIIQYRQRDPDDLFFARRTLVHFAVDPDRAFITTRLAGKGTRFLPFNVGSAGPGRGGGAGNPPPVQRDDYSVSYLWNEIWQRDNWLEILQSFMYVDVRRASTRKTATAVFPRFHQWHAVKQLVADARARGAGSNYLIQHADGSGADHTIAWLAHELSTLIDKNNKPVFDKVIVIANRIALERQLQSTIFHVGRMSGVIGDTADARQLTAALEDANSKIIISTQQAYGFVADQITTAGQQGRRYAVILSDAHSSQGGQSAMRMRQALSADAAVDEADDVETLGWVRESQRNLSYFAFTPTPRSRTLSLFGTWDSQAPNPYHPGEHGMRVPFHVYSMRQAVEEGFIVDVLANYVTYKSKWRLRNASIEPPGLAASENTHSEVAEQKAKTRLALFAATHPEALKQKAEVIISDFRDEIAERLGGRSKAMVVCGARQHALDMYHALKKADWTLPGCGFGVLIAFSGSLNNGGLEVTEAQLNGFSESQLPDRFGYVKADDISAATRRRDEYRILVVVDKYTTGLKQPVLCGMYVDKSLTGIAAVQTLSRLNQIHPLKTQDDVRILDFVNTAEGIAEAFRPWFETTIVEPTDPDQLYVKMREASEYQVVTTSELEAFTRLLTGSAAPQLAGQMLDAQPHPYLQPALERFAALKPDEQKSYRDALQSFVRLYDRIAHVVGFHDPELEQFHQYGRILASHLSGLPAAFVDAGHADAAADIVQETDEIRALAAAGDYSQAEERLTRLRTEDPEQAEPLLLELGFITLPDPDRQLVATAWSAISVGRAVRFLLADDVSPRDTLEGADGSASPEIAGTAGLVQPQPPSVGVPRRSSQQSGAFLE